MVNESRQFLATFPTCFSTEKLVNSNRILPKLAEISNKLPRWIPCESRLQGGTWWLLLKRSLTLKKEFSDLLLFGGPGILCDVHCLFRCSKFIEPTICGLRKKTNRSSFVKLNIRQNIYFSNIWTWTDHRMAVNLPSVHGSMKVSPTCGTIPRRVGFPLWFDH